jgi:hypothetical protein
MMVALGAVGEVMCESPLPRTDQAAVPVHPCCARILLSGGDF